MASGLILDYLGSGTIAERPVSLDLHAGAMGLWLATDTGALSAWDGSTWTDITSGDVDGDVTGPASSTDGNLAVFDGATGKKLKDGGAPLTNPMTTAGDIITGGTSGAVQRLGVGSEDQVLKVVSGAPAWADESGGGGGSDVLDVSTPSNASGTVTLDFASKSRYVGEITLGANVTTLAFSNLPGSGKFAEYELHIKQDGTGSRTFAIPASHKALGGSDTAIASAANAVTVLTASTVDNGTTWRYAMQESA